MSWKRCPDRNGDVENIEDPSSVAGLLESGRCQLRNSSQEIAVAKALDASSSLAAEPHASVLSCSRGLNGNVDRKDASSEFLALSLPRLELTSVTNVKAVIIEETKSDMQTVFEAAVRQSEERLDSFCESLRNELLQKP